MIDRLQDGLCTFAYWENGILKFGTAKPDQIGDWDRQLTADFRAAIAVDPNYLAKFIAKWKGPDSTESRPAARVSRGECRFVQKRLFADE